MTEIDNADEILRKFNSLDSKLKSKLRKRMREVGDGAARKAKANASWSSRIPGAVRVSTSFSQRNPGVQIKVSRKKAPHARPYENVSNTGYFRHPVFADNANETREEWTWVQQDARPFLSPAVQDQVDNLRAAAAKAIQDAAREAGFHL